MKVLFCGHYKDGSGWGHAACHYILALDKVGIDVVPRAISFKDKEDEYPERIKELEQKDDKNCDIIIQNTLPHYMSYSGNFYQNIALYFTEVSHFNNTRWTEHLNIMDRGWVACHDSIKHSYDSNVHIPLAIVPVPCDINKYNKQYDKIEIPELKNKFVFYFIGEFSRRKNLAALLKAYHLEFSPTEPVILLIKSSVPGISSAQANQHLTNYCRSVKEQLGLYPDANNYLNEIIITQRLTEQQICQLHITGDCYVGPSFGEGWGMEAFDAMAFGKTPILSDVGGHKDFLYVPLESENCIFAGEPEHTNREIITKWDLCGWLVPVIEEPIFAMTPWAQTPDLYRGDANWWQININELRKAMRQAYENKELKNYRSRAGVQRAHAFSYKEIGNFMSMLLNDPNNPIYVPYNNKLNEMKKIC